jgi:hypothetical protein
MEKRKLPITAKVLVVAISAALLVSTVALAASYNVATHLRMDAPNNVSEGKEFRIHGRLKSKKLYCRGDSRIKLYKKGKGKIRATRTGNQGRYHFNVRTRDDATYHTKFNGKSKGVHPNTKTCRPSRSKNERVNVR